MSSFIQKFKKELKSWILPIGILAILYFGGWMPEVMGFLQRGILYTGLIKAEKVKESRTVDEVAWEMAFQNANGEQIQLKDLQGKVIFLNQWATWCPPCVAEMPSIQRLYEQSDTSQFAFILLSFDESQEKAERFMRRKGYTMPIYFPISGMPSMFRSQSIPTTWIIDPQGDLVATKVGMADYNHAGFREWFHALPKP